MSIAKAPAWMRRIVLLLAALEILIAGAMIAFLIVDSGSDPLGHAIAQGVSMVLAAFLVLGPVPALLLAWHGRLVRLAGAIAACGPLALVWVWARLISSAPTNTSPRAGNTPMARPSPHFSKAC